MVEMLKIRMIWFVFFHGMMWGTYAERPGITIDCGNEAANTPQVDTPDTGNTSQFLIKGLDPLYTTLRFFPYVKRNCYTLKPIGGKNNRYLIRARFLHGNYDNTGKFPAFHVYVGGDLWAKVIITSENQVFLEMIYKPETDFIHVCLVNIDQGTPFITTLELRPLKIDIYTSSSSLDSSGRYDTRLKTSGTVQQYYSYDDDEYDRFWTSLSDEKFQQYWKIETKAAILRDLNQIPKSIFQTMAMPKSNTTSLSINFTGLLERSDYYLYWHFADTESENREFNIYLMNNKFDLGTFKLPHMQALTVSSSSPTKLNEGETAIDFYIIKTNTSKLPPILNAVEVFRDLNFSQLATHQDDADAMMNIRNSYKSSIIKGWQGDPCLPIVPWDGLNCSNTTSGVPPRITFMNLSSKGLVGEILLSISNLTSLNYLDLSNNSLIGKIPEFLAEMQSLTFIDLEGNKLNGSVPVRLLEKKENGSLTLRLDKNPELCTSKACLKKSKKQKLIPLIACAVVLSLLVAVAVIVACKWKRKTAFGSRLKSKNQCFRHSEIVTMTNNFNTELGEGGFGTVYLGSLKDGSHVAVKMLRKPSGLKSFQTEAELLMRVHHKNLVSLVGYCDESKTTSLVYEYMAKGDVHKHLSAQAANSSSWIERLQISCDAAQGLEYLHTGCKPTIIHRDIKTANILLDENLRAKVADLGMSRIFANENAIDQITADYIAGTFGYLDPEYHNTGKLNEKSDVYSFGVVLMELITGRTAIIKSSNDNNHVSIITWVKSFIDRAEIHNILDQSFGGNFNENSVWKAIEIAVACVCPIGIQRPTMTEVLYELKECLILEEKARKGVVDQGAYQPTSSRSVFDIVHVDSEASIGPSAR